MWTLSLDKESRSGELPNKQTIRRRFTNMGGYRFKIVAAWSSLILAGYSSDPEVKPVDPDTGDFEIPVVSSRGELDALEPNKKLVPGWDVRLALAPGSAPEKPLIEGAEPDFEKTPWRLLYADFRRADPKAEFPAMSELPLLDRIGPFSYNLEYDPVEIPRKRMILHLFERLKMLRRLSDHYLFVAPIPAPDAGAYRLSLFREGKRELDGEREFDGRLPAPIATIAWKQKDDVPCAWVKFAQHRYVDLPDLGIPVPPEMTQAFEPHFPIYDGEYSVIHDEVEAIEKVVEEKKKGEVDVPEPLIGMVPTAADSGFRASLAGAGIELNLKGSPSSCGVDDFLIRWWIDGKPVQFQMDEIKEFRGELAREMPEELRKDSFQIRVPFSRVEALRKAKPESEIAVQFLYCPNRTERLKPAEMEKIEELELRAMRAFRSDPSLRLSNRLQFKLSDVMED